jgi:cell division protein FtsQ
MRRRVRIAILVVLAALCAAAVWLVWFSSVLAVKQVRVVGIEGPGVQAVLTAAAVPVGVPLARLEATAPLEAVLALPWVRVAEVRRGWPSEVVIAVAARVPIAAINAGKAAVDAEGVVFEPVGGLPTGLPTVNAQGVGLEAAMGVLSTLPPDLVRRVVSLSATTRDNVDLNLRSGDLVHWGSVDRADVKAEVLRALMRRKADIYDVTAPELPTTYRAP